MIPIPMHIWETIRHLGAAELDLVDKTDSELLAMVEAEVDRRIEEFRPPSLMILSGLDFSVFSAHCLMGLRTCHAKSRSSRDWNTIRASDDVNGGSMRQSWRCAHLKCVA
jgi:hypothetical protein